MTSPIRAFFNWLALASVVGLLLWREHSWQLRARQAETAPAVVGGGGAEESELLATNGVLQRRASEAEARAGALGAELEALKRAVEAAKPAPGPADLAKQFAAQRGLAFKPAPVWTPAPMEAILDKVRVSVESQLSAEAAEVRGRAALAMGFHSEPFDYRAAVISLAQTSSGGYYDAASRAFFYRQEASLARADGREAVIGGLAAALTRQKGGEIPRGYDPANDDEALALRSLMSGDANAARVRFSIADQLNLNFDRSGAPSAPPPNYSAPAYLGETWKFSQDKGSLFVEVLAGQGGNAAVDAAYARPPRSSAEILHPETLYLAKPPFEPTAVELPGSTVGGSAPYFSNIAGELGTYIVLRSWLGVDEATVASEGWAGDRYAVWPGAAGAGDHVFWKTVWRTEADAREFFEQLRRVLMQRFSLPWRAPLDAAAGQFRVDDPQRVLRLALRAEDKAVTLINASDPAFGALLEKAAAAW